MIRYFHPVDEEQLAAQAPIGFDEDTAWWSTVQKCAVSIALAAAMAISAGSTAQAAAVADLHQDDPAGNLFGQDDEDFWQNPVAPVPATLGRIYLPDPEEIPASALRGQSDEDFYAPAAQQLWPALPKLFSDDDVAFGFITPLPGDEDFWQNAVSPMPASLGRIYLPDGEELPAGTLFGQPDEDFYAPIAQQLYQSLPKLFADDDVAFGFISPLPGDEDFWLPQPAKLQAQGRAFAEDELIVSPPAPLGPDEDFWQNPVSAMPMRFCPFTIPDAGELARINLGPQSLASLLAQLRPAIDAQSAALRTGITSQGAVVRPAIESQGAAVRSL